ncbi:Nif11-like leader peptide family natural product precursor [Chamaesiphon minutus]|uniref:Bacteriocin propeptide, TIGR03798 family n=1 Tax=Chamaesiphon minutus (strain ATCC 27169 / PCC 6605) TaxID=1173020 RepID=K9ULI0_CHAP6|nr:Nif11-like leader peptide family natural product precursor [Chamaesiphon minutus]AFY95059.1 bacteriocin propeptide, TIGR03798 family [Chamaesiphon minutus PCC 6605]
MSAQSVTQFLERVETDEQLQEELAQIIESAANSATDGADRQGATELGKKYGFDFSSEELWAEIKNRQDQFKERQGSGELSDEELEAVAGGGEIWITTIFTATTAIATAVIPKIKW